MDLNTIRHPSRIKKIKCSFLDYVQLLMIGRAGRWTLTPSATPLQSKKWNACFWIMFNFWWSVGLVDGLEPHLPPFSSQKNEMLVFGLCSTSDDWLGWSMDSNPVCHPSPANKIKCLFLDYVSTSDDRPLCSQKNKMLIFGLRSTSDDRSMDSNPVCHPSPGKIMKCLFLDYVQLLMIGWAGRWTQTPSATPLQPKKIKCSFLDYVQLLMIGWAGWLTWTPSTTLLQPKK